MDDVSMESEDSILTPSHLGNLRSLSKGRLLKASSECQSRVPCNVTRNVGSTSVAKYNVSHDSIDLLCTRPVHPLAQRRQTLAAIPKRMVEIEKSELGSEGMFQGKISTMHSPQILGGLQFKTNDSCRRPYKPRNSIDNADVSGYRPPKKLALEPMQEEDVREGQAERIRVYVRLRPMSSKEKDTGARCCVREANRREIYLTEMAHDSDYLRLKRLKGRYFVFDGAFPGDASQEEVYRCSTAQLVEGVLEGRNSSVFCYGATGAGKTFTMLGTVQDPGVMVLALKDLFTKLKQRCKDGKYLVCLSYLEVYNEMVRDLISPGRALLLREDAKLGMIVPGLTQYKVSSEDEVMALLQQGNQNRTTEPTRLNETSSRSHAILQVIVEYGTDVDSFLVNRTGKLSLIDLAGSERAIATDQRTLRSLEGANINRSLLALSSCISALVEGKKHIPFRNSKLTQLLKDSLGGACQTAMIANISPSNLSFGETQNTLYWADRAKEIKTKACVANEELQVPRTGSEQLALLLQLQKENQQLRMQVAQLQQKVLTLEKKALAPRPSPFLEDCPSAVMTSPTVALHERSVQKEIMGGTGTNAATQENHFVHCTENKPNGFSLDYICIPIKVNDSVNSHLDCVASDVEPQVRCEGTLLRTPLTVSSIKRNMSPLSHPQSSFGFHSTSRDPYCRKRTFWDITNTNSPNVRSVYNNTRSNNSAAQTPSMLLQPGFSRGLSKKLWKLTQPL